ncbi:hypothetical protein [Phenylobacterium sp.]|uniref:hypothetical protein n=1 Tax=Phenylobacterium sp. TaxID=1871053 RepID=UPI00374CE62E
MNCIRLATALLVSALVLSSHPALASAQLAEMDKVHWILRGIDVFGLRSVTRDQVLATLPLRTGEPIKAVDKPMRDAWCARLRTQFQFAETNCVLVLEQPDMAYFSVDAVEKGDTSRVPPTARSWESGLKLSPELHALYKEIDELKDRTFAAGHPVVDLYRDREMVDYADPDLHRVAQDLQARIPARRNELIRVLMGASASRDRAAAADLLNFAGEPGATAAVIYKALDDPDAMVRNNVSRYLIKWAPRIQSEATREALVKVLSAQLRWASFGDRNKAIFVLTALAQSDEALRHAVAQRSCRALDEIARLSSAPNVGGAARDLLASLSGAGCSVTGPAHAARPRHG